MVLVVAFVRAATFEASSEWRLRPNFRACHVRDSWNFLTGVIKKSNYLVSQVRES